MNQSDIDSILSCAIGEIEAGLGSSSALEAVRLNYLGKKGKITDLLKSLGGLEPEQRKIVGEKVNQLRDKITKHLDDGIKLAAQKEESAALEQEWLDVSLPVKITAGSNSHGNIHPLSQVQEELENIFLGLGFDVVDGPEVEGEFFNFEALNIPEWHPARDMQDTIWSTLPKILLRTQTSAMQVRAMRDRKPPLRIVAPGRCFRYERMDATHEHTFYQMEGMMIDKKVSVGNLTYFMKTLLEKIFGFPPKIRLRPGYFPFVEPGFELDIWFNDRWLELLPCGLVHPRVLEYGGIDPKQWQGFAFGLGLSRLVMTRYAISDIRHLQAGDLRFLKQFYHPLTALVHAAPALHRIPLDTHLCLVQGLPDKTPHCPLTTGPLLDAPPSSCPTPASPSDYPGALPARHVGLFQPKHTAQVLAPPTATSHLLTQPLRRPLDSSPPSIHAAYDRPPPS